MSHLMITSKSSCTPLRQSVYSALFCLFGIFSFAVMGTTEAAAQPGVLYVSKIAPPGTTFSFNSGATWVGNAVPPSGSSIQILENSVVVLDVDNYTFGVVNVTVGGSLDLGANTVTITDYLVNNGTLTASSSTVVFNSTVADNSSGQPTCDGTSAITFNDVQIPSSAVVDFGSGAIGAEPNTEAYVNGTLSMDGGAVVLYPPFYGGASTLKYNDDYTVSTEWTKNDASASTKGVPTHVEVADGASLSFGSTSDNYTCAGNFTVNGSGSLNMATMSGDLTVTSALTVTGASGSLDMSSMMGDIIVNGNCTIGGVASQSVTLTLPSAEGKGNLDVKGNLTLGESSANALTIAGDEGNISCGGNFTLNTTGSEFGMVEFDGMVQQTFSGNKITVDSLVVSNANSANTGTTDVIFDGDVDIVPGGVFNPLDGTVDADGTADGSTFTMNSDANGTARIATLDNTAGGSNVLGDITFERYFPAVTDGASWLSVGNYVVGASYAEWTSSFGSAPLMFEWDETHVLNSSESSNGASAYSIVNSGTLEDADYGYLVYTASGATATLSSSGGYNTTDPATSLTYSSNGQAAGWHLLTNPYPCPISGSEFLSDNAGLFSRYYAYNNTSDVFETDLTGAPATIDIGQSFWVQVSSAGAVSFALDQLTSGTNSFVRDADPMEQGMIAIRAEQEDGRYGSTLVRFHEESTHDWDWEFDATHKQSGNANNPEIYSVLENGHQLVINSAGSIEAVQSINLAVESGSAGTVSLSMEEGYVMPEGVCGLIEDLETGEVAAIGGDAMVVELEPFQLYENRFILTFMVAPIFEATASHCEGGILHFNGEDAELWDVSWEQVGGELTGSGCVTGLETGDYTVEATDPFTQCQVHSDIAIEEVCMGDFNLNGERDITDLLVLLVGIQPVDNFEGSFPETDCDCDGAMTTLDLLMFLPQFGSGCE
jgi:hypothetical protein